LGDFVSDTVLPGVTLVKQNNQTVKQL